MKTEKAQQRLQEAKGLEGQTVRVKRHHKAGYVGTVAKIESNGMLHVDLSLSPGGQRLDPVQRSGLYVPSELHPLTKSEVNDMPFDRLKENLANYERVKVTLNDGTVVWRRDNGDRLAKAMRPITSKELAGIAKDNGLSKQYKDWAKRLNSGQIRMNLGQKLRAMVVSGEKVTIQGKTIKTL